ncbi:hypothetical protein ACQQ2Q_12920 [Agrobacterium sp. ES01]|uniref:hypothetical protein n=1 Tax=Agrobacterium sp. ES01 TaxID=3420714 RepID=UPI003D0B7034
MPAPILSTRSKVAAAKADKLLKCYAERLPPAETAKRTGLSLNTVYEQYSRIRWRLIEVGYYWDAALSIDEPGLSEGVKAELRRRRGLGADDIYAHAAEAIEWAEEWPAGEVLRHLRKIITLTGPIDKALKISETQQQVVSAYVRYARTKLIHDRAKKAAEQDKTRIAFLERTTTALEKERRRYRAACKLLGRSQ